MLRAFTNVAFKDIGARLAEDYSTPFVLDAGSGGTMSSSAEALISDIGDCYRVSVDVDPNGNPDVLADFEEGFPFPDEVFDIVVSSSVLEHLRHPGSYLRESCRCLREGGVLVLSAPFVYKKHSHPYDFLRFTDTYLNEKAAEAGFEDVKVIPLGFGPFTVSLSLVYLLLKIRILKLPAFLICWLLDGVLGLAAGWLGKDRVSFFNDFAIGYVLVAVKGPDANARTGLT